VHALDTSGRTARCIDLPPLPAGVSVAGLSLAVRGGRLDVGTVASIDRRTFAVARRAPVAAAVPDAPAGGFPWVPAAAALAAFALTAAAVVLRRGTRRPSATY
jgi:hypothetical protein